MTRDPYVATSFAERGATSTIARAAGRIAAPASTVEYPRTFCTYCWLMYVVPIRVPKTMIPPHAATQKVGLAAIGRS